MAPQDLQTLLALFLRDLYAGTVGLTSGVGLSLSDGTASANSGGLQFASEPTLRLWRSAAGIMKIQGSLTVTSDILSTGSVSAGSAQRFLFVNQGGLSSSSNGVFALKLNDATIGSAFKVDALPTVASGFGTSPAITAGSTPLAGSVDVGTGAAATTGVITVNGAAWPSAPFVVCTCSAGTVPTIATASTTQITFTTSVAWPANTKISWCAISSK